MIKAIRHDSPPFDNLKTPLGKLLVDKRLAAGLTQEAVATLLGVSVISLKNWEHNRYLPSKSVWPQIRHFLGGES
ncbi:MAG: helix-turn-helix domain-containing protein [Limisphaerales bacterium]